jgi:ribosome biogenesis GTPase
MEVLPRFNKLERKAVGKTSDIQIIAGNIDHAFIVQSVGHDFNLKRIERYLIICRSAGIDPLSF